MKPQPFVFVLTAVALLLGFATSSRAQSVYLRVEPVAVTKKSSTNYRDSFGATDKTHHRSEGLKVTVRNMAPKENEYLVEWYFLARNAATAKTRVHDQNTKTVTLKTGETTVLEIESAELENREYNDGYFGERRSSGEKPAGYIILVKAGDKVLTVEASSADLKRDYQKIVAAAAAAKTEPQPGATRRRP